mgnify:FL=1
MSHRIKLTNKELDFLNELWERQSFYHSDNIPYQWHMVDNGALNINSTTQLRAQMMYSKHGFFVESLNERSTSTLRYDNVVHGPDQPHFHRQRRYMIQQYIDSGGNFDGPVHISVRPKFKKNKPTPKELSSDYQYIYDNFLVITHPGHTRLEVVAYLQSPIKNAILTINKKYDLHNYLKNFSKINTPSKLPKYWNIPQHPAIWEKIGYGSDGKPLYKDLPIRDEIEFDALFRHYPKSGSIVDSNYTNGPYAKYHKDTDCYVLKLWTLSPKYLGQPLKDWDFASWHSKKKLNNLQKNTNYLYEVWESSKGISYRLFEKQLTIYTNSNDNVKEYLYEQRNKLKSEVRKLHQHYKGRDEIINTYKLNADKPFTFDVVVVDKKPDNISELNGNKGFAIWLDKSIISDFNREIYELIFFTRVDVKLAKTKDGKIEVINCGCNTTKEWIIPKRYIEAI